MKGDRLDALAERLFQAARDERPDAALQRRVREQGAGELARGDAPPASGARSATRKARRGGAAPWLATAAVLSAAAAAFLFLGERTLQREPEVHISAEARSPAKSPARAPEAASPSSLPAQPSEPRQAPAPSVEPSPHEALPHTPATPAKRPRAQSAAPATTAPVQSAPRMPLADQLALLKQARALLRSGQSAEAIAVLDRYGAQGGTDLRDEALLLRIEALAAQGQSAAAAELARHFASKHPDSPLAERARRLGGLR